MVSPETAVDPGNLAVLTSLTVMLIFMLFGSVGYIVILRPKLRLRRRMLSYGLVGKGSGGATPVSYTHLTLPTICSV